MLKGKNYKVINKYGIQYKITNKETGLCNYIINKHDIDVDFSTSNYDYIVLIKDIDGEYFAHPILSSILIEKLMSGWEGSTINLYDK